MSEKLRKLISERVRKDLMRKFRRRAEASRAQEIWKRRDTPGDEIDLSEVDLDLTDLKPKGET